MISIDFPLAQLANAAGGSQREGDQWAGIQLIQLIQLRSKFSEATQTKKTRGL